VILGGKRSAAEWCFVPSRNSDRLWQGPPSRPLPRAVLRGACDRCCFSFLFGGEARSSEDRRKNQVGVRGGPGTGEWSERKREREREREREKRAREDGRGAGTVGEGDWGAPVRGRGRGKGACEGKGDWRTRLWRSEVADSARRGLPNVIWRTSFARRSWERGFSRWVVSPSWRWIRLVSGVGVRGWYVPPVTGITAVMTSRWVQTFFLPFTSFAFLGTRGGPVSGVFRYPRSLYAGRSSDASRRAVCVYIAAWCDPTCGMFRVVCVRYMLASSTIATSFRVARRKSTPVSAYYLDGDALSQWKSSSFSAGFDITAVNIVKL